MINQSAEGRGRRPPYNSRGRGEYSNRGRGQRQPGSSGETRAQFGQQEPSLGQAVLSDSPPPGLTEPGKTLQGVVVALLDSYGFIRQAEAPTCSKHLLCFLSLYTARLHCYVSSCRLPGGQSQIFFHGSEVQDARKPSDEQFDLRELLQLGDEVSFGIKHVAHKDKKINAVNVHKLQQGTIAALQSANQGRYRGSIQSLPGESSWRSQVKTTLIAISMCKRNILRSHPHCIGTALTVLVACQTSSSA